MIQNLGQQLNLCRAMLQQKKNNNWEMSFCAFIFFFISVFQSKDCNVEMLSVHLYIIIVCFDWVSLQRLDSRGQCVEAIHFQTDTDPCNRNDLVTVSQISEKCTACIRHLKISLAVPVSICKQNLCKCTPQPLCETCYSPAATCSIQYVANIALLVMFDKGRYKHVNYQPRSHTQCASAKLCVPSAEKSGCS